MTKQDLQNQLKQSMLAKTAEKTSVLRMLISAITYFEIQKGGAGYEASEEDVMAVIQKEAKQRKDSIEEYTKAGRTDLVDKEQSELDLLQTYLPAQMSEEEIKTLVEKAVEQTKATTIQDLGKVMGVLVPQTKGKADGSIVSRIVREKLHS
ncbi:MAG TPA: GatB/YqeY domain-containing protein [Patescibacteria group bacterium]|nr:GatB/YqeY domain-containing protein [Patescibacteria group bacterium]